MPITVLNKDNVPTGPFTRAQVAEKLQSGEFSLASLAFVEGLSEWTPLRDVLARVDAASPPVPLPLPVATPLAGAPAYSYAATMQPPSHLVYAGFWIRFAAYFLDGLILGIPMTILSAGIGFIYGIIVGMNHSGAKTSFTNDDGTLNVSFVLFELAIMTFSMIVYWLYFALQESSSTQATVGKRIVGVKVTNLEGQRIGFGQASGRYFGKIISGMTLLIGYIMAGFTERKQALHDMLAGTLVVKR
jgi:uncharacterized RDD family membrane protein YckC